MRDIGEQFGEVAARDSLVHDHGCAPETIRVFHGSGVFDVVGETPDGRIVIIEAKGPNAELGSRIDLDGNRSQQGTRPYAESILDNMSKTADPDDIDLVGRIQTQLELDDVRRDDPDFEPSVIYEEVKPKVEKRSEGGETTESYGGYNRRNFDLRPR
ncbi:hypothetical protein REH65_11345 [Saccharopolyspora sp. ID03-671]|uniref:hypothetical protein n=1 Tax=Saccharopolyspora sp. ID03-671 TaxID=3073066 RepID=UPI003253707A